MTQPPGPESEFVEVETDDSQSVAVGQWIDRDDGTWALRITDEDLAQIWLFPGEESPITLIVTTADSVHHV